MVSPDFVHLRAAGVSLLLDTRGPGLPGLLHLGADLGSLGAEQAEQLALAAVPAVPHSAPDSPRRVSLLPALGEGAAGRPGLLGHRNGQAAWPAWRAAGLLLRGAVPDTADRDGADRLVELDGGARVEVSGRDEIAGLTLRSELELTGSGLLRMRHELRHEPAGALGADPVGADPAAAEPAPRPSPYQLDSLRLAVPLPAWATELLDLTGRWCRERIPQRHELPVGAWVREGRHGRTGHDATLLMVAGTPGFGFRHGEVLGVHLGWSGDHETFAERTVDGQGQLGAAELLAPGEVDLAAGESYTTPWLFVSWSDAGLDGLSARLHRWLRDRPDHPRSPRPVVLNTWEAVYFDHDLDRLRTLADEAAALGVERFVLDDGWFRHRRDDTAGLGDWYVDETTWPDGLGPLIEHVRGLGMQMGLWVEPEMVNLDSDLARAHPDWVLGPPGRTPTPWRNQQVLDVADPGAWSYLLERLDALLSEYPLDYLKWDHNRDLVEPSHGGRPAVRAQTLATYRLLDELRRRHPGVEIESCASGGARVDLGILARTDRVWASDSNDALERQSIQRWTGLLLPPELVGAHVGPPVAHTSGRTHRLSFRAVTALFGHAGIEWDIGSASPAEREALAGWIRVYRDWRGLLHSGDVVRADHPDPAAWVHGVVAADRSEAAFGYVMLASSRDAVGAPIRLPGLDPARGYRVSLVHPAGAPALVSRHVPPWWARAEAGELELTGAALARIGLAAPGLCPEEALVLRLRAV